MLIEFSGPLDLASTLKSGQAFRWTRVGPSSSAPDGSGDRDQQEWFGGVIFDNVVKLRRVEAGIEFEGAPDDESVLKPLLQDYLRLDDDLESIYRTINTDDLIGSAIARYSGMRILRQDPWECLVSFICSSTSNIPRISANVEDMSTHFGLRIEMDGIARHTFPTSDRLAEAGEARLRQLGLGFRAKYVAEVARIVAGGEPDLFALRESPYEDVLEALTALPGVGDKVANCAMLFSMDKLEAFPVDVWVRRALQEWYLDGARKKVSVKDMRPWAQSHFGAYAGYANQYLFHGRRLQGKASD